MTDNINPYKPAKAGDLITSEIWNDVQVEIKKDIQNSIQDAKTEIKKEGVDKAIDADKFGDKTPTDWTNDLDKRYAPKVHSHEGQSVYRKYYNRFTADTLSVLLKHNLGAFPLVDVYELMYVFDINLGGVDQKQIKKLKSSDGKPPKFFLYLDHDDRDKFGMYTSVYRDRVNLGIRIGKALNEYNVDWKESDSLGDVIQELWDNLFAPPNDDISHAVSPSIEARYRDPVSKLIENDEWDDIYLAFRPQKFAMIPDPILTISQVSYNTLKLEINKVYFKLWVYLGELMNSVLNPPRTDTSKAHRNVPVVDPEMVKETWNMILEQVKLVEHSELENMEIDGEQPKLLDHVDIMTLLRI